MLKKYFLRYILLLMIFFCVPLKGQRVNSTALDSKGKIHMPIGIPNTVDTLKTFVEAEGNFSPGVGSYGIYFCLYDKSTDRLYSATMEDVQVRYGLAEGGKLIPWSMFTAGDIEVRTEVCQVKRNSPEGTVFITAARVILTNNSERQRDIALYAAIRPVGPAGFDVKSLSVSPRSDALFSDGLPAIIAKSQPSAAAVVDTDTIGQFALKGKMPTGQNAHSESGDCSGALRFDISLKRGQRKFTSIICPVLAGRRAVGHQWDGVSEWAQFDLAELNPTTGGRVQPNPGIAYYRSLEVDKLFQQAEEYWENLTGQVKLDLPDNRWEEAFAAIMGHVAMAMNEGAPDVAVVNYNVFNRDGVYVVNILQKSGRFDLAQEAIEYFVSHPFNGRSYPEADNPGQILWAIGQHWLFTHDKDWLNRILPSVIMIAEMVEYYRTTPGPHWVQMDELKFGEQVSIENRRELKAGRCDGHHPEYTEAFDLAGVRAATELAEAAGREKEAGKYSQLAEMLSRQYDKSFGEKLANEYGSYCVLWPCRLYSFDSGKAYEQFKNIGPQEPSGWRYFALAKAHQALLAGNREAGYETLNKHLDFEQMRGWYLLDEGGKSGAGGWGRVRTRWNGDVAMPHGWAVAEFWLLLRDCLVFEDKGHLILLAGIPPKWFTHEDGFKIERLPTYFGRVNLVWQRTTSGANLTIGTEKMPPNGYILRLPTSLGARVIAAGKTLEAELNGNFVLGSNIQTVKIEWNGK
jgi:hypothetical protein